jgi:uncharacterized HAD superfamily protein
VKNVGIDIDGVVADFNRALAVEMGVSPTHAHPDQWDWPRKVAPDLIVDRVWAHVTNRAEWWFDHIKPYAEAVSHPFLRDLHYLSEEANLYFITARPQVPGMKKWTEMWLRLYLKLTTPSLIIAQDKGLVAQGIGLTHFLDDNADNCTSVAEQTAGRCATFIIHRPYNAEYEHRHVKRIHTLADFTSAIGPLTYISDRAVEVRLR